MALTNEDSRVFSEIYGLDPDAYTDINVEALPFSIRVINRMYRMGVKTVAELLNLKMEDLLDIPGFGKKCQDEIVKYIESLSGERVEEKSSNFNAPLELYLHRDEIRAGQFGFVEREDLSEESLSAIKNMQEARDLIDAELIDACFDETEYISVLLKEISSYSKNILKIQKIKKDISAVNPDRLSNMAMAYIYAYAKDDRVYHLLSSYVKAEDETLEKYLGHIIFDKKDSSTADISNFMKWLCFDIQSEISEYLEALKEKERDYRILQLRAQRKTLEYVGKEFDVTRERVRQIESKAHRKFRGWENNSRILHKIYADRNGDSVLTSSELIDYFGEEFTMLLYLFKDNIHGDIIYDPDLDSFIVGDSAMPERVQDFVDNLPDTFNEREVNSFLTLAEEQELSVELVKISIDENYKKTGEVYHRSRLTLTNLYGDIMRNYYPNGMHIYDSEEISRFKEYVHNDYGIVMEQSDHAIGAVIARICILCGRGRYRLNDRSFISDELVTKIHDYIRDSDAPVFLTNTLFSIFEDELISEGIDNKYFLQGILRDRFGDEWNYRRDYISKDSNFTSVYASIIAFIKKSNYPVRKEEIFKEFPGITEIIVNIAISDPEIINLFGSYIHGDKLKITSQDRDYIETVMYKCMGEKRICHCKTIFDYIENDYPSLLKNNYISIPFCMYSLIEHCFGEKYNFSRPYIAQNGVEIEKSYDVLREMVKDSDRMEISEIQAYARNNFRQINSILEFIDGCNETHLLINKEEMASIELIGVNEAISEQIEQIILEEIEGTMPITQLNCIHRFPKIQVQWNEWLIYGVIKKWSQRLEVVASSNKFSQSIPLISISGNMDISSLGEVEIKEAGSVAVADDLNNIDDLISDYILEGDLLDDI